MLRIQPGHLLDLGHRGMGQAELLHRCVNVSAVPSGVLQGHFQMLSNAAAGDSVSASAPVESMQYSWPGMGIIMGTLPVAMTTYLP